MGFFSSKTKHILATSVQTLNLMEPSEMLEKSTLNAIQNKYPIAQALINDYVGGGKGFGAQTYYNLGRTKYTNGLIEGSIGSAAIPIDFIQEIIEATTTIPEGMSIRVGLPMYDFVDEMRIAIEWVKAVHPTWVKTEGTSTGEFELSDAAPRDVLMQNAYMTRRKVIIPPDPTKPDDLPREVTITSCNVTLADIRKSPQYSYRPQSEGGGKEVVGWDVSYINQLKYSFDLPEDYQFKDDNDLRYLVPYWIGFGELEANWKSYWWEYYTSEGLYPQLDPSEIISDRNYHMPVIPLRLDNRSMVSGETSKDTPLYKTSNMLTNALALKLQEIANGIDENPDVKDIDHAYFVIAPKVTNTDESTSEYFFRYFRDLYVKDFADSKSAYNSWFTQNDNPVIKPGYGGGDGNDNNNSHQTRPPTSSEMADRYQSDPIHGIELYDKESHYRSELTFFYMDSRTYKGSLGNQKYKHERSTSNGGTIYARMQLDETTIVEYSMVGVKFHQLLWKAWGDGSPWSVANLMADEDDNNFLIPVNASIVRSMSMVAADKFIQDSCTLVVQAWEVKKVKVKWYQSSFFNFVFKVVTIVITVVLAIPSGGASFSWGAAALAALQMVAFNMAFKMVFTLVANTFGIEVAMVLAIAFMAFGGAEALGSSLDVTLATVDKFIMIVTNFAGNLQQQAAARMAGIQKEITDFEAEKEAKQGMLEAAQEELENTHRLDPMGIYAKVDMALHESPNTWMARKTLQNPGELAIDAVHNFVDNALLTPIDIWRT